MLYIGARDEDVVGRGSVCNMGGGGGEADSKLIPAISAGLAGEGGAMDVRASRECGCGLGGHERKRPVVGWRAGPCRWDGPDRWATCS